MTEEKVLEALKDCYDPEIPVNVVDLGLIYGVRLNDDQVEIDMTLTAPGCPMHVHISRDVEARIRQLEGVGDVKVNVVWEPRWTPDRISVEGKRILGLIN